LLTAAVKATAAPPLALAVMVAPVPTAHEEMQAATLKMALTVLQGLLCALPKAAAAAAPPAPAMMLASVQEQRLW